MATKSFFAEAPLKVRAGRVLIKIGSILFFIGAVVLITEFVLSLVPNEVYSPDWTDASTVFGIVTDPLLALFYIFAGIGGFCYVADKHKLKVVVSLAGVIMLIVIVIATVLMFRNLIKSCLAPDANVAAAWYAFLQDFISIQLSGGIYFLGWFLTKDYTGD